jgi:uncharacterized protein (UPF0548 family)
VIEPLSPRETRRLTDAAFTYRGVGCTKTEPPDGYRSIDSVHQLPGARFEDAAELLMTWQMHERAGLHMQVSENRARPGAVVKMRVGPRRGPLALVAPCRVVYSIEEPTAVGFAYGTLPGHPVAGEELFLLSRGAAGVTVRFRAFSRPDGVLARAGGPLTTLGQKLMLGRYRGAFGDGLDARG